MFGWNDTSGTLLSFRGWALHGLTTGVDTQLDLPPLSPFMPYRQGPRTNPVLELDNRAGYYGRLEWRPPAPVASAPSTTTTPATAIGGTPDCSGPGRRGSSTSA